ncbi:putative carbonic anhydrase 5 [Lycorma delicatula]|uniref:putative carbonic anhydrase 5 n=1 Tax=Lycorma delicatula TaxID=130591 RepID=UPI003F511A45
MTKIELPELKWLHMDSEPNKIKIANTGQTVIVSGTWQKNRPRISGGPLLTTYTFSQLHYHWGSDNTYGSEHSYNDKKVPLEMHAVFLKESCKKQEDALAEKDGAVVVSYAYKVK